MSGQAFSHAFFTAVKFDVNYFVTEGVIMQKPVYWFALQINGLVSIW